MLNFTSFIEYLNEDLIDDDETFPPYYLHKTTLDYDDHKPNEQLMSRSGLQKNHPFLTKIPYIKNKKCCLTSLNIDVYKRFYRIRTLDGRLILSPKNIKTKPFFCDSENDNENKQNKTNKLINQISIYRKNRII